MSNELNKIFQSYLLDLAKLVSEEALASKIARNAAADAFARQFQSGRLMAYYEVISLMQQQALVFGLDLMDVGLAQINPDSDLI